MIDFRQSFICNCGLQCGECEKRDITEKRKVLLDLFSKVYESIYFRFLETFRKRDGSEVQIQIFSQL